MPGDSMIVLLASMALAQEPAPPPPSASGEEVTELEGASRAEIKEAKPHRHELEPLPRAQTDFTAYTLEWGEAKIGLGNVSFGVAPRVQLGTVVSLDALRTPNLQMKANFQRNGPLDLALVVQRYDLLVDQFHASFTGLGVMSSVIASDRLSLHGGAHYVRIGARGEFDVKDMPEALYDESDGDYEGARVVPHISGEAISLRLAADWRFNRRDSLVLQAQSMVFGQAIAGISGDFPKIANLDVAVTYGGAIPPWKAYAASLSWQFAWKHWELRAGIGRSAVPFGWFLQAWELTYRFGGPTRVEERHDRHDWREDRRDWRKGRRGGEGADSVGLAP